MARSHTLALMLATAAVVAALVPPAQRLPPRFVRAPSLLRRARSATGPAKAAADGVEEHVEKLVGMHGEMGEAVFDSLGSEAAAKERSSHNEAQAAAFDSSADFFASAEAIPPEIEPKLQRIAEAAAAAGPKVVDVGTGAGALLPFYEAAGIDLSGVVGVDLAAAMLGHARAAHPSATFWQGDFLEFEPEAEAAATAAEGEEPPPVDPAVAAGAIGTRDAVVINACFGNMFDQGAVLRHAISLCKEGGRVVISHPLGSDFVEQLREKDPGLVPHPLPSRDALDEMVKFQPVRVVEFRNDSDDFYLAVLERTPTRAMPRPMRLAGPVGSGFGRGSRKLGFPTANLAASLFGEALADVPTGVYFGWATIEGDEPGCGRAHKAVVNIGMSPTFEEQNPEKIAEAHLIGECGFEGDFYGKVMRMTLVGSQRPELKFPSFPMLVAQITKDVKDAEEALEMSPYNTCRWDPWLKRATLDKGYAAPAGPVPEWGFVPFNDLLDDVADEMQGMSWQELAGMPPPPKPGSVADTGGGGSASGIHPSWGG